MKIIRSEEEVNKLCNEANDSDDKGTKYPGMTYEQGIMATIAWILGDLDEWPMD